ncbi:hypothetical protein N7454_003255 [Penicillium verhagenii]|nr:hypothetical protein N7454_003255 [Penicillium verhagenii]
MPDRMSRKYIVTFQDSATAEQINNYIHQINRDGGSLSNTFPDMIARGFSAYITDSVLRKLQSDPLVDRVTPDDSS